MNTTLKILITLVTGFLLFPMPSLATAQTPDYLIYQRDTIPISSNPLESYLNSNPIAREILKSKLTGCISTGCWRSYVAYWTLRNDSLFLVDLRHCCYDDVSVKYVIPSLFNEQTKTTYQFAFWFTRTLVSKQGDLILYVHSGYRSIFEKEIIYPFSAGHFKGQS